MSSSGSKRVDHTFGNKYGYLLEASATSGYMNGYFISKEYPPTKGRCLSFWFILLERRDELFVQIEKDGRASHLWFGSFVEYAWREATITIRSSSKYKIRFVSVSNYNEANIDDILFTEGLCEEGSCDFERGKCSYLNSKTDDFDWLLGSGATTSKEGPWIDHTSQHSSGQYIFIAPSSKEIHESAVITSEGIQVDNEMGRCISFWYFMIGKNVGSLEVQIVVSGTSTLWRLRLLTSCRSLLFAQ